MAFQRENLEFSAPPCPPWLGPFLWVLQLGPKSLAASTWLSESSSHQDDLCPWGGGDLSAWRVCAGPTKLSCLMSIVLTSFRALGFVCSFTGGDLLQQNFANRWEPWGHLHNTAITLSVAPQLGSGARISGQPQFKKDGGKQKGTRFTDVGVAMAKGDLVSVLKELARQRNPWSPRSHFLCFLIHVANLITHTYAWNLTTGNLTRVI